MDELKVGDIVIRKSYGGDIYFKIVQIVKKQDGRNFYILKGTNLRIMADAPGEDLEKPSLNRISLNDETYNKKVNTIMKKILLARRNQTTRFRGGVIQRTEDGITFGKAGKVMHLDGDEEYLNVCLRGYKQLGVEAIGRPVPELQQPEVIMDLLKEYRPDILVITGHDGMLKGSVNFRSLDSYRNSKYFVKAVKIAREFEPSYDDLVIFAGACQSHFEALIDAGANFASSPHRILIHALDPVFICEKIAFGSISKFFTPQEILENTITGTRGIGGLQTRGKFREGTPKSPYE
ncbi:sporulation peptidase YabG [Fonticella tunisiensis]|uniref:Spore coat assembly protein n=1 Tax=Fonticella tunisiensis TaxID=1096341 RepID=A0A4R7KRZ9_9CLOT|nr:sporulation peptidase YabG [Fonticella tunisiensis]TDT62336.1 spore coat assembly protein [Fonticella tunisiensis]